MFCPQCQAEYQSGFTRCSECEVPLVAELPTDRESHAEPVVVRNYPTEAEANVARTVLEAAGIASTPPQDIKGGLPHNVYPSQGADILVRPEDLQAAEEILAAAEAGNNALGEDVPQITDSESGG